MVFDGFSMFFLVGFCCFCFGVWASGSAEQRFRCMATEPPPAAAEVEEEKPKPLVTFEGESEANRIVQVRAGVELETYGVDEV